MTEQEITERDVMIKEWHDHQTALKHHKEREAILRKEIVDKYFTPQVGKETIDLGKGYKLVATKTAKYDLVSDNSAISEAWTKLDDLGINPAGLIKYKAELSVSGWKNIPDEGKEIADAIVVNKPFAVTMELRIPTE